MGALLARHCDAYVHSRCPSYPAKRLEMVVRQSRVAKGRLLHYFSMDDSTALEKQLHADDDDDDVSSWCGWHNDHGSLTGLTPAMYLDEAGQEVDPSQLQQQGAAAAGSGGLFVLSRSGEVVQVVGVPADHLIFQIGETAEIHSGGVLQATPHAVKGGCVWTCVRARMSFCKREGSGKALCGKKDGELGYRHSFELIHTYKPTHALQRVDAGREPRGLRRLHGARVVSEKERGLAVFVFRRDGFGVTPLSG